MKFRKKPVVIEAEQWTHGGAMRGVCFCKEWETTEGIRAHVHTTHKAQAVYLADGDWVIPEPDGRGFYPCKPDIFAATYEPVEEKDGAA